MCNLTVLRARTLPSVVPGVGGVRGGGLGRTPSAVGNRKEAHTGPSTGGDLVVHFLERPRGTRASGMVGSRCSDSVLRTHFLSLSPFWICFPLCWLFLLFRQKGKEVSGSPQCQVTSRSCRQKRAVVLQLHPSGPAWASCPALWPGMCRVPRGQARDMHPPCG